MLEKKVLEENPCPNTQAGQTARYVRTCRHLVAEVEMAGRPLWKELFLPRRPANPPQTQPPPPPNWSPQTSVFDAPLGASGFQEKTSG